MLLAARGACVGHVRRLFFETVPHLLFSSFALGNDLEVDLNTSKHKNPTMAHFSRSDPGNPQLQRHSHLLV